MKLLNGLLVLCIELFTRCFIITWMMYFTATKTSLFSNWLLKILVPIIFMSWVIISPTRDFIEYLKTKKEVIEK